MSSGAPREGRDHLLSVSCHLYAVRFSCLSLIDPKWKGLQRTTLLWHGTFSMHVQYMLLIWDFNEHFSVSNKDTCAPSSGRFHFYSMCCVCLSEALKKKKKNQSIKVIKIVCLCGLHVLFMGVSWHITKLFRMHITPTKHAISKLKAGETSENVHFTENDLHLSVCTSLSLSFQFQHVIILWRAV